MVLNTSWTSFRTGDSLHWGCRRLPHLLLAQHIVDRQIQKCHTAVQVWVCGNSVLVCVSEILNLNLGKGCFTILFISHPFFILWKFFSLPRNGLPIAISPKVKSLVEEVMNDLGKSAAERKLISVYTAYGFDLFRAGSTMVSTGGVVGVPHNFKYSEQEEFDHTGITVSNLFLLTSFI